MFSHVMLGTDDVAASKRFYDAALGALGVPAGEVDELGRAVYAHDGGRFVIRTPLNGEHASGANGGTLGFQAPSTEAVDALHAAGLPRRHRDRGPARSAQRHRRPRALPRLSARSGGNKICALHRLK